MHKRDYRDILGGAVMIGLGGFAAIHALTSLSLGTVSQMGPGMFPAGLGIVLVALGIAIVLPALRREGEPIRFDLRSLLAIGASVLVFLVTIQPFGLVPAVVLLVLVASRADGKLSAIGTLVLSAGLALLTVLLFRVALGVSIPVFSWPW